MANGNSAWTLVERILAPLAVALVLGIGAWFLSIRDDLAALTTWRNETHPLETEFAHEQLLTTIKANQMRLVELEDKVEELEDEVREIQ